jgi:hypothetical protein
MAGMREQQKAPEVKQTHVSHADCKDRVLESEIGDPADHPDDASAPPAIA